MAQPQTASAPSGHGLLYPACKVDLIMSDSEASRLTTARSVAAFGWIAANSTRSLSAACRARMRPSGRKRRKTT